MGICFDVYKRCPRCGSRAVMQLRGGVEDVDLDDHKDLAQRYNPEELLALFDRVVTDGDPFICPQCGWDHRFHLDTDRRRRVAQMLFGDAQVTEE